VTLKGQTRDPNQLKAQYLETAGDTPYVISYWWSKEPQIRNDMWGNGHVT